MRKFLIAAATLVAMVPFSASADKVKLENGYISTDGRVSSTRVKGTPQWFVLCDQDTITDLKSCTIQYGFGEERYGRFQASLWVFVTKAYSSVSLISTGSFPGNDHTIRIDKNKPIRFDSYSGGSRGAISEMILGKVIQTRTFDLHKGSYDQTIELAGFKEAYAFAKRVVSK